MKRVDDEWLVGLGMVSVGFFVASIGVVLVLLADDLSVPLVQLAWVGSSFGYWLLVMALIGPRLLRLGAHRVLAGAALLMAIGTLAVAVGGANAWLAYGGAVVQGLGAAGITLVAPRLLHGPSATAKLTRANAAASLAGIAGPLLLGLAVTVGIGGRLPLLLICLAMLALAGLAWRPRSSPDAVVVDPIVSPAPMLVKGVVLRRWLAQVCAVSVEFAFVVWGVARLLDTGLGAGWAAIVAAGFQIGMASGRVVGPWLISRLPMVLVGSALAAVGTVMAAVGLSWWVVGLGQLLAGFGTATLYPITLAHLMATPGLRPEVGASLGALGSGVAIVAAPALLAALAGVIPLQLAFLAPLLLLGALYFLHQRAVPAPA